MFLGFVLVHLDYHPHHFADFEGLEDNVGGEEEEGFSSFVSSSLVFFSFFSVSGRFPFVVVVVSVEDGGRGFLRNSL